MINESNNELIKLLHSKVEQAEEKYLIALTEEKETWELQEIKNKIIDLQKCIEEISFVSPDLRRSF